MKRFVAVATLGAMTAFAVAAGVGCKKDPPQQPQPLQPGGYPPGQTGYPPQPGYPPAGTAPAGYPPAGTAPPTAAPPAQTAPPATATGCDATVSAAMQPLLVGQVAQHAPGAKPEGTAVCGMLQEGQSMQVSVTLAAGGSKCYTGIGIGAPSYSQLDLQLVGAPPPPLPPMVLSQSSGGGPMPVMAGKPNCFKNISPFPLTANFKLTATKGSGPAMAQLYAKLARRERADALRRPARAPRVSAPRRGVALRSFAPRGRPARGVALHAGADARATAAAGGPMSPP